MYITGPKLNIAQDNQKCIKSYKIAFIITKNEFPGDLTPRNTEKYRTVRELNVNEFTLLGSI